MRPSVPATATVGVVALLLTACSGASGGGSSSDDKGPITAYVERVGGDIDRAQMDAQHRRSEEVTAQCMAELGFEYTPTEPASTGGGAADDRDLDWESMEFAQQYGYGYTTSDELFGETDDDWTDPNQERLEAMSEAEAAAYSEALWGTPDETTDVEDPEAVTEWDWETGGCSGKGFHEAYEKDDPFANEAVEAAFTEWNDAWSSVSDDPSLTGPLSDWATCMVDAGHDVATPDEARASISEAYDALYGYGAESDAELDPEADPEAVEMPEPDPAAVAELRKKEIALAVADRTCQEESGYQKAYRAVLREVEERIWEKYGDELEAAAAAAAATASPKE